MNNSTLLNIRAEYRVSQDSDPKQVNILQFIPCKSAFGYAAAICSKPNGELFSCLADSLTIIKTAEGNMNNDNKSISIKDFFDYAIHNEEIVLVFPGGLVEYATVNNIKDEYEDKTFSAWEIRNGVLHLYINE